MQPDTGVTAVAHVIQLAVAPVFLLSGIGAMLSVMTNRLARVVDRARVLDRHMLRHGVDRDNRIVEELSSLSRRAKLISLSIGLCTVTALLVCAVIAVLFIGAFLQVDTSKTVALVFITAMAAFIAGLLLFLREIFLATATVRIGLQHLPTAGSAPADPAVASGGKARPRS
jgi:hypothetical protein